VAQFQFQPFSAITSLELPHRVKRRKSHFEQLWSAPPQIADTGCSREDFSLGPDLDMAIEAACLEFEWRNFELTRTTALRTLRTVR
jgi:hypothetical protein